MCVLDLCLCVVYIFWIKQDVQTGFLVTFSGNMLKSRPLLCQDQAHCRLKEVPASQKTEYFYSSISSNRAEFVHTGMREWWVCETAAAAALLINAPPPPFINMQDAYITPMQSLFFPSAIYKAHSSHGEERSQFMLSPSRPTSPPPPPRGGAAGPDFRELLLESRHGRACEDRGRRTDRWGEGEITAGLLLMERM